MRLPGTTARVGPSSAASLFVRTAAACLLLLSSTTTIQAQEITTDCSLDAYYAEFDGIDVVNWDRAAVENLITRTHQVSLVKVGTQAGQEDVFSALRDVDAGASSTEDAPTVHLLMRDLEFDADLRTPEGWTRGDLWPATKTADPDTTQAGTDVHAKRPVDWEVERELRGLFWGTCGVHDDIEKCVTPAVPTQTASDTATDRKIQTPPAAARGDVARSLLYLVLRYGAELGLAVTDCPPFDRTEIGYLSELLEWHRLDPPGAAEQARNARVCERWQGNRNPLVDHPALVEAYFGTADAIVESTQQYAQCTAPTDAPTAAPNACQDLRAGDVQVLIWNGGPLNELVLFPVSRVPADVGSIFVTDRAWDGTRFLDNGEGTLEYSISEGGLEAGAVFGYNLDFPNDEGEWEMEGTFDIPSDVPDNMLVYCLDGDEQPHFLSVITTNNGAFTEAGLDASSYTVSDTAQPADVTQDGSLALPFEANYLYVGSREGSRPELVAAFKDPANYEGRATPYDVVTSGAGGVGATKVVVTVVLGILVPVGAWML